MNFSIFFASVLLLFSRLVLASDPSATSLTFVMGEKDKIIKVQKPPSMISDPSQVIVQYAGSKTCNLSFPITMESGSEGPSIRIGSGDDAFLQNVQKLVRQQKLQKDRDGDVKIPLSLFIQGHFKRSRTFYTELDYIVPKSFLKKKKAGKASVYEGTVIDLDGSVSHPPSFVEEQLSKKRKYSVFGLSSCGAQLAAAQPAPWNIDPLKAARNPFLKARSDEGQKDSAEAPFVLIRIKKARSAVLLPLLKDEPSADYSKLRLRFTCRQPKETPFFIDPETASSLFPSLRANVSRNRWNGKLECIVPPAPPQWWEQWERYVREQRQSDPRWNHAFWLFLDVSWEYFPDRQAEPINLGSCGVIIYRFAPDDQRPGPSDRPRDLMRDPFVSLEDVEADVASWPEFPEFRQIYTTYFK